MRDWLSFAYKNPHEFTIQYPPRREYFKENYRRSVVNGIFDQYRSLLLYIHIPFCESKCHYCNFAVNITSNKEKYNDYVNILLKELDEKKEFLNTGKVFNGIDIGGGTPTRLPINLLYKILQSLQPFTRSANGKNILSIETTPSIASRELEKIQLLYQFVIDRISMGVQTFDQDNLTKMNRSSQNKELESAIKNIREAKITKLNIDLIFGLPDQTLENWVYDLERILEFNPESITTYDCLYRGKGRVFTRKRTDLPSMNFYGKLYDKAYDLLIAKGYHAEYGSVNFSKSKMDHGVSPYFKGRLLDGLPYIGIGNYASSQVGNYWYFNPYHLKDYLQFGNTDFDLKKDFYFLPDDEIQAKYILSSLNFGFVDEVKFFNRFQKVFTVEFSQELDYALQRSWIIKKNNTWQLKEGNFKNLNYLRSLFYSPNAKKWLKKHVNSSSLY